MYQKNHLSLSESLVPRYTTWKGEGEGVRKYLLSHKILTFIHEVIFFFFLVAYCKLILDNRG